MPDWDASLYLRFGDERTQPTLDLLARISLDPPPRRIIDLGCGPGNSAAPLRNRWPAAKVIGLDSSAEMIERARAAYPGGQWLLGDLGDWRPFQPFDLIFSNAALHWAPDHGALFPRLFGCVAPGGALAVQMPARPQSALHESLHQIAQEPRWRGRMGAALLSQHMQPAAFYHAMLGPLASRMDLWLTEYFHVLDSPRAAVEWIRGAGLRPFLEALEDEDERQEFERRLTGEAVRLYPPQTDGRALFPFKRLFLVAYR